MSEETNRAASSGETSSRESANMLAKFLAKTVVDAQAREIYAPVMRFSITVDTFNIDMYSPEGTRLYVIRIPMREMIRHIDDWKFAVDKYKELFKPMDDQAANANLKEFYQLMDQRFADKD